mgnify:CR=1 FL=1|jgi:hypothetical protein
MKNFQADYEDLQLWLDVATGELDAMGLDLVMNGDMREWYDIYDTLPPEAQTGGVSNTLHPEKHNMGLGEAFWTGLYIRGESELMACHCVRLLRIRDFVDEFVSGRLFSSAIPEVDWKRTDLLLEDAPRLSGNVAFGGGLWVHPKMRGMDERGNRRNLSGKLNAINRNFTTRHFNADWYCSLTHNTPSRQAWVKFSTGILHSVAISRGYYAGRDGKELEVRLNYVSRDEMFVQMRAALAGQEIRTAIAS